MRRLLSRLRERRSGARGEELACRELQRSGFEILERNWRCRSGEVDIVARDGGVTVFVEVKERTGESHGKGFEAVTYGKRRRIVRASRLYAAARGIYETPIRYDVISIDWSGESPGIRHDRGAFDSEGG